MTPQSQLIRNIRIKMAEKGKSISDRKVSKATGGVFSPANVGRIRDNADADVKVSTLVAAAKAAGFEVIVREIKTKKEPTNAQD